MLFSGQLVIVNDLQDRIYRGLSENQMATMASI